MKNNITIPNKTDCFYILEMLKSNLIDYSYTQPWADKIIDNLDKPPSWLCDLSMKKYQGDQISAISGLLNSEPFEETPQEIYKFHIGCLWLRYKRREISWATFLFETGSHLDGENSDWDCETPYHYLNIHADNYFTIESEEATKKQYLNEHDLQPWIELAKSKFEIFQEFRKTIKSGRDNSI